MKKRLPITLLIILLLIGGFITPAKSTEVPRMTKEKLESNLDNPDLIIIDVRLGMDWKDSDLKIKGAVREDPADIDSWANRYPKDKIFVFYCA